jgi:hypothetical protein
LNEYGDWNPICNVLEGKPPFFDETEEELQLGEPETVTWLPKFSEQVREKKVKGNGNVYPFVQLTLTASSIPGVPASAGILCKYVTTSDFGAVLLTAPQVRKERYYHKMPFIRWFKRNAGMILKQFPEVKDHGVWIITATCSAPECALNVWRLKNKEIVIGFSGTASQTAALEARGKWYTASSDSGWNHFKQEV